MNFAPGEDLTFSFGFWEVILVACEPWAGQLVTT